jgi:hypothetical protein
VRGICMLEPIGLCWIVRHVSGGARHHLW